MNFFESQFVIFIIYAFFGWIIESNYVSMAEAVKKHKYTFINRGFLKGPIVPIYGVCSLLLSWTLVPLMHSKHPYLYVALTGMLVADTVEYITSYTMEKFFHARWWDYSDKFLNIKGRICFKNTVFWGGLSIIFVKFINPLITDIYDSIPRHILKPVFWITFLIFMYDFLKTVSATIKVKNIQDSIDRIKKAGSYMKASSYHAAQAARDTIKRSSKSQLKRIRHMYRGYPNIQRNFLSSVKEADLGSGEIQKEFRYLIMDFKELFNHDKNEMM